MSPGNQIRALTAKKATPKRVTINIGRTTDLIKLIKFNLVLQKNRVFDEVGHKQHFDLILY